MSWSSMSKNIGVKWNLPPQRLSSADKPTSLRFWGNTIAWRYRWVLVNKNSNKTEHTVLQQWILSPLEEIKELGSPQIFIFLRTSNHCQSEQGELHNKSHCSPRKAQRQNSKVVIEQRKKWQKKNKKNHTILSLWKIHFFSTIFFYKGIYSHSLLCKQSPI